MFPVWYIAVNRDKTVAKTALRPGKIYHAYSKEGRPTSFGVAIGMVMSGPLLTFYRKQEVNLICIY